MERYALPTELSDAEWLSLVGALEYASANERPDDPEWSAGLDGLAERFVSALDMHRNRCYGSGARWAIGTGVPICPVCHRGWHVLSAKEPGRNHKGPRKGQLRGVVPEHTSHRPASRPYAVLDDGPGELPAGASPRLLDRFATLTEAEAFIVKLPASPVDRYSIDGPDITEGGRDSDAPDL